MHAYSHTHSYSHQQAGNRNEQGSQPLKLPVSSPPKQEYVVGSRGAGKRLRMLPRVWLMVTAL